MPERVPNALFASWFQRSGWSKGEVARMVNRRARDLGATHVATDTSRVRRWLDGEQPRDPIPRILTELFSERFGCVVTLSDLGLREPSSPIAGTLADLPWGPERTAELLAEFCRSDLLLGPNPARRVGDGAPPLAAGTALIEPVKRWLLPYVPAPLRSLESLDPLTANGQSPVQPQRGRPGRAAVLADQLEETLRVFRDWEAAIGGGIRRSAVTGQLYEVAELIRHSPEPAHPRIFRIAALYCLLAGEMALDSGLQAAAQRYLVLGLHAAKESSDRNTIAVILAATARQLVGLNRAQDALDLLAVGRSATRGDLDPLAAAFVDLVEARGYGALGRIDPARLALERARTLHAKGWAAEYGPGSTPLSNASHPWPPTFTPAAVRLETARALRDLAARLPQLTGEAAAEFDASAGLYERDFPRQLRGRVEALTGSAEAHAVLGHRAAAVAALRTAGGLAVRIRSRLAEERLREAACRVRAAFPEEREPGDGASPAPSFTHT
ncbi:hypothetical protein [Actinospica sp.]|uniref:hypothetical protein n=1 Tax=Actinospica sp. TaxID=1872142 RepID=UPI002C869425|nr:hypothetical protein [Actinospica sp.]HWG28024.1 hypothetical protein [Actinospica sp.]